ncbi:MetQ/NlpA family ABC transporter substrate-binding protein [Granulicoccus phenolivorans]|uniref:MetQ/NlpA family ABC transporter substrate-binding protein n=1 Tax=Granulicoccus phenolivorans TaxID=266854 RepID=UPI000406B096|nr:MetQ/NlpA family ABC transporter substrate-binding protein [Granulicoccus phenolivorans]
MSRKFLKVAAAAAGLVLALTACSSGSSQPAASADANTIRIGVSPVPHAEIIKFVADGQAKDAGLKIEVTEFQDYVQPNVALNDGSLDANYFQHKPYLDEQVKQNGYKFAVITPVHLEPLGVYSQKVKDLNSLPTGGKIGVPNDPSNEARALKLLHDNGVIQLKDPNNLNATPLDIAQNPKNLTFSELEAAQLTHSLPDLDAAVINGNYALQANLTPSKDAIAVEKAEGNPYANVLVVKEADANKPSLKKLGELLCSQATKDFINQKYQGSVIPAC